MYKIQAFDWALKICSSGAQNSGGQGELDLPKRVLDTKY